MSQIHNEAVLKYESLSRPGVLEIANSTLKKDQKRGNVNEATSFSSFFNAPRVSGQRSF